MPSPNEQNFRRLMIDTFAAAIVLIFALDTLPCTPSAVRNLMEPLIDTTGLWQGTWNLFAPIPDSRNHRLRADLYYLDGTHRVWNSPDWQIQSMWQRFVGHRETEFLEKISDEVNRSAWHDFAMSVSRQESLRMKIPQKPKTIVLSVIWGDVSSPEGDVWKSAVKNAPLDQEREIYTWTDRAEMELLSLPTTR